MTAHLSVSVGSRAVGPVREAIDHAAANPDHDPIVWFVVADVDEMQRVRWTCPQCPEVTPT